VRTGTYEHPQHVTGTAGYWAAFNHEAKAGVIDSAFMEQTDPETIPPTLMFTSQSSTANWWPQNNVLLRDAHARSAAHEAEMSAHVNNLESARALARQKALAEWDTSPGEHVHRSISRFPQLLGDYYDKRTVNYHNTVGRALGAQDSWLRYEFGGQKGNLHSHSVAVSTTLSIVINRARDLAEQKTEGNKDSEFPTEATFRRNLAHEVDKVLTTSENDGAGDAVDPPGYSSWQYESKHAAGHKYENNNWKPNRIQWLQPEGEAPPLHGNKNPCKRTLSDVLKSPEHISRWRADMDNSSYNHKCTTYCAEQLPQRKRTNEAGTPYFKYRFETCTLCWL
jgi:hypothetical protein